jgi:hypothetical protein
MPTVAMESRLWRRPVGRPGAVHGRRRPDRLGAGRPCPRRGRRGGRSRRGGRGGRGARRRPGGPDRRGNRCRLRSRRGRRRRGGRGRRRRRQRRRACGRGRRAGRGRGDVGARDETALRRLRAGLRVAACFVRRQDRPGSADHHQAGRGPHHGAAPVPGQPGIPTAAEWRRLRSLRRLRGVARWPYRHVVPLPEPPKGIKSWIAIAILVFSTLSCQLRWPVPGKPQVSGRQNRRKCSLPDRSCRPARRSSPPPRRRAGLPGRWTPESRSGCPHRIASRHSRRTAPDRPAA